MIAIVGTTYLEMGLEEAVSKHFNERLTPEVRNKIFRGDAERPGPLGDFYDKIEIAHVLGVLSEEAKSDFHIFREIRNAFAHSMLPIDFSTEEVHKLLSCVHMKIEPGADEVLNLPGIRNRRLIYFVASYHFRLTTYDPDQGEPIEP